MTWIVWPQLALLPLPLCLAAECLPQADMQLYAQHAWAHRTPSYWRIMQNHPYRQDNGVSDLAIRYDNRCELIANALRADFSLVGLAAYPWRTPGAFAREMRHARALVHQMSLTYPLSERRLFSVGKLSAQPGPFYIKSPAELLRNYDAGFKASRIYSPALQKIYVASFWGIKLSEERPDYGWSFTLAPQLTSVKRRDESFSNWPAIQRSNASERYLLSYSDYRLPGHAPSVSVRLGDSPALAVADSFYPVPRWMFNAELAWHAKRQWRHFSETYAAQVKDHAFPAALFQRTRRPGMELALSAQYSSQRLSQFGVEYYFQSEGYSRQQWRRQRDFLRYLHRPTGVAPWDRVRAAYTYLMAAEIENIAGQGNRQGKHYLNTYAAWTIANAASLQAYRLVNLQDNSAMLGLHLSQPLTQADIDIYGGAYCTQGNRSTEFGLIGKVAGIYSGIKYYF